MIDSPASTLAPTDIKLSSGLTTWEAVLNGYVNTNGSNTDTKFCYGTTSTVTFGVLQSCTPVASNQGTLIATDSRTATVEKTVTLLTAGTTYYYQARALNNSNNALASYGEVRSFFTGSAPTVTTDSATALSDVGATLTGTITHNGITATGAFCISKSNTNVEIPGILDTCFLTLTATVSGGFLKVVRGVNVVRDFSSSPATVYNGDILTLKVNSSPDYSTSTSVSVSITGENTPVGVLSTFTVTTRPIIKDTIPNIFSFVDKINPSDDQVSEWWLKLLEAKQQGKPLFQIESTKMTDHEFMESVMGRTRSAKAGWFSV